MNRTFSTSSAVALLRYRHTGKFVARRHLSRLPARSALQKASPFEVSTGDPRPASGEGKGTLLLTNTKNQTRSSLGFPFERGSCHAPTHTVAKAQQKKRVTDEVGT